MAEPVEHDLRDRTAALQRLEASLVIDGLGQAEQRAALVDVAATASEGLRGVKRAARERERGVDQLGLVANGLHLVGFLASGRVNQRVGARQRDRD